MKKIFFVSIVTLCVSVFANAQDVSSLGTAARLSYEWLQEEGYKPRIDEGGDVSFKVEGWSLFVHDDNRDENYLMLVMPSIESVDVDENPISMLYALAVCNEITRDNKMIKAWMTDSGNIWLTAESYIDSNPIVGDYLKRAIRYLLISREKFIETYEKHADSE